MRRFALAAVLMAGYVAWAQTTDSTADVKALIRGFNKAQQTFDQKALRALTTTEYVEVSPVGDVDPREKMIGFYAPENKIDPPPMTLTEEEVRVFGDTAVETVKITYSMPGPDGALHDRPMRGTFTARHEAEGWKLVSSAFTPMRSPATK